VRREGREGIKVREGENKVHSCPGEGGREGGREGTSWKREERSEREERGWREGGREGGRDVPRDGRHAGGSPEEAQLEVAA